jgi:REP element-mobilizing transposase RayT
MDRCFGVEIMPDHVHLFLNCPPVMAPDQIMFGKDTALVCSGLDTRY